MPLTPLHLGPALSSGFIFRKRLDIIALAISSIILDVECIYKILIGDRLLHASFFHSLIGAITTGIIMGLVLYTLQHRLPREISTKTIFGCRVYYLNNRVDRLKHWLRIEQKSSFSMIISGSVIGTVFHVFLDAFLYPEMNPFYPLTANPLYNPSAITITYILVYTFCVFCFIPAGYIYFKKWGND